MLPLGPPSCQQITHSHIGLLLTYIMAYSDGRLAFFPANHDPFWWQSLSIELWLGYVTSDYAGKHIWGAIWGATCHILRSVCHIQPFYLSVYFPINVAVNMYMQPFFLSMFNIWKFILHIQSVYRDMWGYFNSNRACGYGEYGIIISAPGWDSWVPKCHLAMTIWPYA